MAGILLTNTCNLHCPYCFAQDRMKDANWITIPQLNEVLDYHNRSNEHLAKLIGGEPTLHPQFGEIIKTMNHWAKETYSTYSLFTNGIKLQKYLNVIDFDYSIVIINYNSPRYIGEIKTRKIYEMLDEAARKELFDRNGAGIRIGFNIFKGQKQEDLDSLYYLIKKYGLKSLRVSTATPPYKINRDDFFNEIKDTFVTFIKTCQELGITHFDFDCNEIPYCYFTDEELEYMNSVHYSYSNCCNTPVLDISGNMTATCCLGCGCQDRVDLHDFSNLDAVRRYFQGTYIYPQLNKMPQKCKDCQLGKTYQCFGGCLSFTNADEVG